MKFWRGNKVDAEFDAEPTDVAAQFADWFKQQPADYREGMRLERALRSWMTSKDGFNASWTDETPAGFGAIFDKALDLAYPKEPVHVTAEIDTSQGPTFDYSGPDYSVNHVS